ncbi:MAG TPA: AAA family ATPase, partial [Solirubrobacteraceae bacterium]
MRLLDRAAELEALDRTLAAVRAGGSRAVLVIAEPGLGKSALLAEAARRAEARGMRVLLGRAAEHEREVPFALAVDALDRCAAELGPARAASLGPDLAAVLPSVAAGAAAPAPTAGPAERHRFHRALAAFVEHLARERPLALLLDDLHWADDASVEWVLHMLRRPPRGPVALVLALRPVDPADALLAAARDPSVEHLRPAPLSGAAARELLGEVPEPERARIAAEAEGNPLFLGQLARAGRTGDGSLPPTLRAAVAQEVAALPAAARRVLEGAAVAGDPFDAGLAASAADVAPGAAADAVDALVAAGLVRPSPGGGAAFAFRHPLVRRAVYDGAPPAWRSAAHERAVAALAERGAGPVARAHHVERSARPGDAAAVALLAAAGERSADTAPGAAAHWYRAALRLAPEQDAARRAELTALRALALGQAGRDVESHAALLEALELLEPGPSPERLALEIACAEAEQLLGRVADARARLTAAIARAAPGERPRLLLRLAGLAFQARDPGELAAVAAEARAAAPAGDEPYAAATDALGAFAAFLSGDGDGARSQLDRALAALGRAGDAALGALPEACLYVGMVAMTAAERARDAEA